MTEFNMVSVDELNQIEGGSYHVANGTFTIKLPPGGGLGATGDGGGGAGGGGGPGFIWGSDDPKLPD